MEISGSSGASGLQAFQSAQLRVDQATTQIAQNQVQTQRADEFETRVQAQAESRGAENNDDQNQINAQLQLQQSGQQAEAAADVLRTEDKVIGSLLDISA